MSRFKFSERCFVVAASLFSSAQSASAQVIDFETLVATQAVFGFDVNNDGSDDVVFSSTDPAGFNTTGPNPVNQFHLSGQVLETSSASSPDIRVDFLGGATGQLQVDFALLTDVNDPGQGPLLEVFDQADNQLGSMFQCGELLPLVNTPGSGISVFPEERLTV